MTDNATTRVDYSSLTPSLAIKLGSLVVHVREYDPVSQAAPFDLAAMHGLASDPEVVAWLAAFPAALLPERRGDDKTRLWRRDAFDVLHAEAHGEHKPRSTDG